MYAAGQGIGGFVSGLILSPVMLAISSKATEKAISQFSHWAPSDKQVTYAAGAIGIATAVVSVLESSPFMTGFKVATVAWTAFAGAFTGMSSIADKVKSFDIQFSSIPDMQRAKALVVATSTIAGIIIGTCAYTSFPAYPAVSCLLAGIGTYQISKLIAYVAVKQNLSSPHPEFS